MPKHSGLVDWDPDTLTQTWFHRLHDDSWVYQTIQDVEPIIESNKWNQNHNHMTGGFRRVASIPNTVIAQWLNDYGIWYYDPDPAVQRKIDDMLNSNEWRHLRTDDSVL